MLSTAVDKFIHLKCWDCLNVWMRLDHNKEAAGSRPCRLHSTWSARGNLSIYQETKTPTQQQQQQLQQATTQGKSHSQSHLTKASSTTYTQTEIQHISVATQTEYTDFARTETETETEELFNFNCHAIQKDSFSTTSSVIFDGIINSSLELLVDITDTTNDIARITRDAEKLFIKMPVGTNFENSALKASFSLSSLPPSTGVESSEHVKIKNERPYNSLTKKRKDPKHENWRKSWGSNCDNKDDFWSALQANYDYIMDNNLIDSCQEIDRDIRTQAEETWTLNQLISHFSELCFFLNDIQDTVYGKAENVTNWALRTSHMEEMSRVSPRRKLFNDQANRLMVDMPGLQDEVSWRVSHLNSKWEQVENALSTNGCSRCEQESCPDIEHEVRCLRKWVKEMESRLQPLNFHLEWTIVELEKKALEHMVLQRDIENHSKIVSSVVRLCNRVGPRDAKCHASNARRVANGLERRYHLLFLRSLEWQCHIESLFKLHNNRCQDFSSDADSDEEPCMKQPRLSSDYVVYSSSNSNPYEDEDVSFTDTGMDINSEPVSVKMVNNGNEHEREINNFEHKASTEDYQNHCENGSEMNTDMKYEHEEHKTAITKSVQNLNSSGHEKSPKDKNTLQKLPISVEANIGSYYYKHRDTDSELDTNNSIISMVSNKDQKKDESSEDEFTYCAKSMDAETIPEATNELPDPDKECIQRLVQRVEELVSTPKVDPLMFHTEQQKSKLSRVKEWLNFENDKPIDSCDASGECTSGESEEDKESQSSEDLNDSIVTCRPQQLYDSCLPLDDSHTEELAFTTEPCKVNLRPKRFQMKGNRPWSVSCLSQFSQISPTKSNPDPLPNFSISESALNNLGGLTPNSVKIRPFNASANSIGIQGNNSTSSTVEESGVLFLNEGTKPISVRKKKIRLRKKHIVRKNESGSESQNYRSPGHTNLTSFPSKPHIYTLVKSGSFSGSGSRVVAHERNTASDPSTRPYNGSRGVCDTSTTSGADSEDDKKIQSRLPKFLLGPHSGMVKGYCTPNIKPEDRDSSPEKSSLNTAEEQSSSLSEQAWDNYQEKYLSENYSEAHDSDAARRLLEFGEDYRCYLDSQSDCWSAHSQNHSPQFRRKPTMIPQTDSDAEIEDIKQYINESKAQLKYTIDIYDKHVAMELNEFLVSSDCGEIIATCERHIYGLEVVIDANDDTKVLPDIEVMEVKALMSAWMDLKWSAKKMQSSRALYNEVISFKKDLSQYAVNSSPLNEVKSKEELTAEIDRLTEVQNVLHDKKRRLLELNVAIHRYIINENTPCYTNLKSEVSDLYTLWNDTCQSVNERMNDLNGHLQVWAQLESRLDELQSDLRSDGQTLRLLDTALNGGVVSMEVASSVRDVAKVLSESKSGSQKYIEASSNQDAAAALFCNRTLSLSLLTEGSFSDSGISDEGSEQELSEREHRLAAIRRLVRHLETIMAPDSEARIKMTQRLEEAENELRKLQSQCRGLIVRTAVCAEVQSQNSNKSFTKRKFSCDLGLANGKDELSVGDILCGSIPDGGDPDNNPDTNGSWFWRVVRASVPFQVALVALICMACLLEPSCCDSINNLSLSLTPQLRYVRGPPPV